MTVNFPLPVRKGKNKTELVAKEAQEEEFNMDQFNPWHVDMTG